MKKRLFIILFVLLFIPVVYAENDFIIDASKIEINAKGNSLIEGLEKSYKIETKGFVNIESVNEEVKEYTKKIIKIIFNNNKKERSTALHKEQFISSNNGFDTLSSLTFINMFVDDINELNMKYDYLKLIRTIEFSEGVISLSYFPKAKINDVKEDLILVLFLKKGNDGYKLFYPWFTRGEDLEEYFNKLGNKEDSGDNIGGTYRNLTLGENTSNNVNTDTLDELYRKNKNKNVSISALEDASTNVYGSGFYIGKGLVVTSWSLLLEMLNNSEFLYVNDVNKKSYNIEGIVSADTDYDVVVLKLDKEVGEPVVFSSNKLKTDDFIFVIDSKNNNGLMINYGKNITEYNGKYKNLLALNSSDIGSALYNEDGEVVGFNTNNSLNNDISIANSTDYIVELQDILNKEKFEDIKCISFSDFKERYYHSYKEEKQVNEVSKKMWDKYKKIGDLENNVSLNLLKASYVDDILSLRYKNEANKSINTFYLTSNYENQLLKDGYELTYDNYSKRVYTNGNIEIIIKQYLDYLIIIMMEN